MTRRETSSITVDYVVNFFTHFFSAVSSSVTFIETLKWIKINGDHSSVGIIPVSYRPVSQIGALR